MKQKTGRKATIARCEVNAEAKQYREECVQEYAKNRMWRDVLTQLRHYYQCDPVSDHKFLYDNVHNEAVRARLYMFGSAVVSFISMRNRVEKAMMHGPRGKQIGHRDFTDWCMLHMYKLHVELSNSFAAVYNIKPIEGLITQMIKTNVELDKLSNQ